MELEIGHEPGDLMQGGLSLDERHEVRDSCEWVQWARRVTERPDLTVVYNREEESFTFCQWLDRDQMRVQELELLPKAPDRGGWMSAQELHMRCRTQHELNLHIARQVRRRKEERDRLKTESMNQRREAQQFLKGKGMEAEAAMLSQGKYAGDEEGGEQLAQLKKELIDGARSRVVTGYGSTGDRRD